MKVHAPPVRPPGAFCRYVAHAIIAERPEDVTCGACLIKMRKGTTPRPPWPRKRHWWNRKAR